LAIGSSYGRPWLWHDELDRAAKAEVMRLLQGDVEEAELLELSGPAERADVDGAQAAVGGQPGDLLLGGLKAVADRMIADGSGAVIALSPRMIAIMVTPVVLRISNSAMDLSARRVGLEGHPVDEQVVEHRLDLLHHRRLEEGPPSIAPSLRAWWSLSSTAEAWSAPALRP
jgi:hypothetical protein